MEDVKLPAWGLADDLLETVDKGLRSLKYLLGNVEGEALAIADIHIREVVDRPKISPWLKDNRVVGVFALRGDIYTLTDPLGLAKARRIAVVLEIPERFVAVGLDEMTGVQTIVENLWTEFESSKLPWAKRFWDDGKRTNIELNATMYSEAFAQTTKEPLE